MFGKSSAQRRPLTQSSTQHSGGFPLATSLLAAAMALSVGFSTGCASLNANGNPAPELEEPEYREWLDRVDDASQPFELIRQLDTRLMGRVTLMTPALREAWAREYARLYRLPSDDAGRILELERKKSSEGLELLVWVAAREYKLADMSPAAGLWRMSLKAGDGSVLTPTDVKWERKPDRVMTWFFPHLDPLGRTYHVVFPTTGKDGKALVESHPLTFQIAGVQGQVELSWSDGVAFGPRR